MLVSQLAPAHGYPHVQGFLATLIDMQFSDVRAMLQLPRPDVGITPGCNFAITSTLCNLLSGLSTTVYKPAALLREDHSQYRSGAAFQDLVRDFFPHTPPDVADFPYELYQLCRNPLAHSVGLMNAAAPVVSFTRIFGAEHNGVGPRAAAFAWWYGRESARCSTTWLPKQRLPLFDLQISHLSLDPLLTARYRHAHAWNRDHGRWTRRPSRTTSTTPGSETDRCRQAESRPLGRGVER